MSWDRSLAVDEVVTENEALGISERDCFVISSPTTSKYLCL